MRPTVRLDRLLSNLGYASRREVALACRAGSVTLNGEVITKADYAVPMALARAGALQFDGEVVDAISPLTLMLNKPLNYTCSNKGPGALVYDLLPARFRLRKPALSTVGRLDKDSSGQLLFTDDGDLLHRIIHPKTHAPKHYRVHLQNPLRGDEAARFASGALILQDDDKPLKPAIWQAESASSGVLILTEGRYHQVRRMFAALGNHVTALHRFQTGGLALGELAEGAYQILSVSELQGIFAPLPSIPV